MRPVPCIAMIAVLAVACDGKYKNPGTGQTQPWSFDESASAEAKAEAFKKLELEKSVNEAVLRLNLESGVPNAETVALCEKNLEEIAKAKQKLRDQGVGG